MAWVVTRLFVPPSDSYTQRSDRRVSSLIETAMRRPSGDTCGTRMAALSLLMGVSTPCRSTQTNWCRSPVLVYAKSPDCEIAKNTAPDPGPRSTESTIDTGEPVMVSESSSKGTTRTDPGDCPYTMWPLRENRGWAISTVPSMAGPSSATSDLRARIRLSLPSRLMMASASCGKRSPVEYRMV